MKYPFIKDVVFCSFLLTVDYLQVDGLLAVVLDKTVEELLTSLTNHVVRDSILDSAAISLFEILFDECFRFEISTSLLHLLLF